MSTFRARPTLPAFALLTALLVTPALVFARPSVPQHQVRPAAAVSVGRLGHQLRSLRGATGMSIDPNGVAAKPASGGSIDPWGHGAPAVGFTGDSGVTIDPNG